MRPQLIATAGLAVMLGAGMVSAQSCRQLLVAPAQFCANGTSWQNVPLVADTDKTGTRIATQYGQLGGRVWLLFSRVPEGQLDKLPWRPKPDDLFELLAQSATGAGSLLGEEIERFYPLDTDVMVASIATRASGQAYVNIYTYYLLENDSLVVQTGIQGATDLTEDHKALHIEAVRAVQDASQ